jgi:photosystem II stability/assembly factor-like uncharacterized protein
MKSIALFIAALIGSYVSIAQSNDIIASDFAGDLRARHIGPALMSGRISDIEGHPTNSQVVWVGTAGGGVWKSGDGGLSFIPVFDDYCQSIGAVTIDPVDPDNSVWVGTGEVWTRNSVSIGDGIYKTSDGGKSWKNMGLEKTDRISSIKVNPTNPSIVYAGALGSLWGDSPHRGVYKTVDGGKSWEKILFVNETTGCSELIMDPQNPDILYAAFWEFRRTAYSFSSGGASSALFKSTDGGKTWAKIHNGFPTGKLGRIAVSAAPSNSKILYAVIEAENDKQKGLYRSDDAGANWKFLNGDFGLVVRPFYFSRISIDPKNPDILVKAGLFGSISRDGGKTFGSLGSMHADIHDIWFDPNDSQKMFVGTDGGVYRSMNAGSTLQIVECLPVSQFYHVSLDNREPYYVYGGLQDNNSWFGPSSSPGGVEARDWELVGQGDGFRVYPHPSKPHIVYSEMQGAETVWRYDTETRQIKVIKPFAAEGDPKLRFNWNAAITTSLYQSDRLYIGSQFLHMSNDMGNTWKIISPDLTTNDKTKQNQADSGGLSADNSGAENHCTIFTIAESPKNEKVIWVGTDDGQVQLTTDGGKNWTNLTANIAGLPLNTWCYHIEPGNFSEGTAYAIFDGHTRNDYNPYIFKTTDFGKTWKGIATPEIKTFVRSFQEDLTNPELLFAGSEMGLYISLNGGKNWSRFTNKMPAVAVHHIEMHPKTHDLVMATHGRGIIILDNADLLSEINSNLLDKQVHFFKSEPTIMSEKTSFGGTSTEHQFVGENPSTNAQIIYFLPKRHTFGKMSMELLDSKGNYITKLEPGKQKGINIVEWGFSTRSPKSAKGKTFAGSSLFSPRAEAGTYKVRLTKGNEVFEHDFEIQYDPKSPFTIAERQTQQKVTKQLYNAVEELGYLVYQIDTYDEAVEAYAKSHPKAGKHIPALNNKLDQLRDNLVITKGDNYVGQGEPKLREKLGDIFSTIGSYYGAPSSSQMATVQMLESELQRRKSEFEKILSTDIKKFESDLNKEKIALPQVKTKDAFLKPE